jgi:hypothetical protein
LRPEFPGEGKYDSRCSCCYLGFSHTVNKHNAAIGLPLVS